MEGLILLLIYYTSMLTNITISECPIFIVLLLENKNKINYLQKCYNALKYSPNI